MIVMEEFGKALALEPYLQTVVLCGALLKLGASAERRAELIGAIAAGDLRLSFAHAEKQSGFDLGDVALSAVKEGGGGFVEGEKRRSSATATAPTNSSFRRVSRAHAAIARGSVSSSSTRTLPA